ncbi:MAG TPA: hypothetical protein VKV30_06125 [Candidatus Angelobacter sp.]|nr:hypothetical protein [Candidatus Angelobacter sp.]
MSRKLLVLFLAMASAASGQQMVTTSGERTEALQPTKIDDSSQTAPKHIVQACAVQRHNKLRRGRAEQVAVFPVMSAQGQSACTDKDNPRPSVYSLRLNPVKGFSVLYGDGKKFSAAEVGLFTRTKNGDVILFKLRAEDDLPPGNYMLTGKLTFLNSYLTEMDIAIPVTVVEHDAHVAENSWHFKPVTESPIRNKLETAAVVPLLPFLYIYYGIKCSNGACE